MEYRKIIQISVYLKGQHYIDSKFDNTMKTVENNTDVISCIVDFKNLHKILGGSSCSILESSIKQSLWSQRL